MPLFDLPNEILQQILIYLPPPSVPLVQTTSRRFNDLIQPLLWRYHCRVQFKYWDERHSMPGRLADDIAKTDWKSLFRDRHSSDRQISDAVDDILSSQTRRIEKFERIAMYGYDAKDTLLRHMNIGDGAEDVLARRYYSGAALDFLHRTKAVSEWASLSDDTPIALERALAAFDMFVLRHREGDIDEIVTWIDGLANDLRTEHPDIDHQNPRDRAHTILRWLRKGNLVGIDNNDQYFSLPNNFVGIALQNESHPSLPLISVAIFCFVADRFGLRAKPCGFPFHVHAIIKPSASDPSEPMYFDPFQSEQEIPVQYLQDQLMMMGNISNSDHQVFLNATSSPDIVLRSARNIMTAVQRAHRADNGGPDEMSRPSGVPDLKDAFYSALWASMLFDTMGRRTQFLPYFLQQVAAHFPADISMVEKHVLPLFLNGFRHEESQLIVEDIRAGDSTPKKVKRRSRKETTEGVQYKVGQVFRHRRYGYTAVITGWDIECSMSQEWQDQMRVHELGRGKHQGFYHVLVEDRSMRYVAEDNVEVIKTIPHYLMPLAGQYFKRYDTEAGEFVSNIRDEYPDD